MIADTSCSAYVNNSEKIENQLYITHKNVDGFIKIKPESDCNPFVLFNWLSWLLGISALGNFQTLAITFFRVIILSCLVCSILWRGVNYVQQPLTHQMISIRTRQREELNNLTCVYNYNANIGHGDYMTICVGLN